MDGLLRLKDQHGNDLYYGNAGDVWVAPSTHVDDYRERMKTIRHLELNDGDVILVSFPRSGTMWHHQILSMLMKGTTDYVGIMSEDQLEWCSMDNLTRPETPRLYSTHLSRFRFLPQQVKEKKVKVIYCYRNPKDCWVSFYNLLHGIKLIRSYEGTWHHFFDLMMACGYNYGDWFDHVLHYENAARDNPDLVFLSCYELMKKDPLGQVMKIDHFLGLNRGRQLCERIAEACEFSKLKPAKETQMPELERQHWKEGYNFFRKGEIGDWKNWFTVAQNEQFDAVFKKRMPESELPFFFE